MRQDHVVAVPLDQLDGVFETGDRLGVTLQLYEVSALGEEREQLRIGFSLRLRDIDGPFDQHQPLVVAADLRQKPAEIAANDRAGNAGSAEPRRLKVARQCGAKLPLQGDRGIERAEAVERERKSELGGEDQRHAVELARDL